MPAVVVLPAKTPILLAIKLMGGCWPIGFGSASVNVFVADQLELLPRPTLNVHAFISLVVLQTQVQGTGVIVGRIDGLHGGEVFQRIR